ncbi:MAG: hypothetical protein Q9167_002425 [Letrouitia subvulpina]
MTSSHRSSNQLSQSTYLDPLDIDQYINFDPSGLATSESSRKAGPTPSPIPSSSLVPQVQQNQQTFAGPSFEYELHKQQTSLPVGAIANTLAVNQADHTVYGHAQRMLGGPPADAYFGLNNNDDPFDFNTAPSQPVSNDMEIDFGSPVHDMPALTASFVNPIAIGGQELPSEPTPDPHHRPRAWPGMHQQQALAKAQKEQQRQQAIAQQQQQQRHQASRQQPNQRPGVSNNHQAKDPIVEERISRLLNQMRHSSVSSSNDDDLAQLAANGSYMNSGRLKKDEEDMDEDERLLASEEGKKLSSKERRQLRNKVSARAFRSRRKEYIGQLEGEIASKTTENDTLRSKNEELMAENTRLTDLTRMLLGSRAFSTFLNELSGGAASTSEDSEQDMQSSSNSENDQSQQQQQQQQLITHHGSKDVNPHAAAQQAQAMATSQNDVQIGMALLPETTADYTTFDPANMTSTWAGGDFGLYDAQVYAVTSMPEYPAVFENFDADVLSGKSSSSCYSSTIIEDAKFEGPVIGRLGFEPKGDCFSTLDDRNEAVYEEKEEEKDHTYDLYDDDETEEECATPSLVVTERLEQATRCDGKADGRIELVVRDGSKNQEEEDGKESTRAWVRFERLCAGVEGAARRLEAMAGHL